jgi:aspartyl-tRNA(Asn)/glutamyl-tRNA(Gln) amidotransferase subunit A
MADKPLYDLTIHEASQLLASRDISAMALTEAVLKRIKTVEPMVNAYISICSETALKQAEAADKAIEKGKASVLTGIPLAIKDLICTKGHPTTCASKMLADFISPYDAAVMETLDQRGAVMVGKANMDEFAMGSSTENSAFKTTKNPWDLQRIPGGSSGGSAAAVSAGMCLGSLGSDTGGSIRQPASHCGVVGIKPTYGRVSRYGLVAFASSLDQIGPITSDVTDAAILLEAISGYDPRDSTSIDTPVAGYQKELSAGIRNMTIGIPREYMEQDGIDPEVTGAVLNAVRILGEAGAKFIDISLPHTPHAIAAYYLIAPAEASSNLARYDGVKYGFRDRTSGGDLMDMYINTRSAGFGAEVKRRILLGTYALSSGYYDAYYKKASQVRTLIKQDFEAAFNRCDVVLSPVAPTAAFKIGEKADDPLQMYLSDIFTLSANLAGIPAMSVPCALTSDGLPIGLQIMGNHFKETDIIRVSYAFEQQSGMHLKKPSLG